MRRLISKVLPLLLWALLTPCFATLPSTTMRVNYAANGATVTFSFPYYFQNDTDLAVYLVNATTYVESLQTYNSDYTVTGATSQLGGSITFTTPPASGNTVVIFRSPPLTQGLQLSDNDALPADALMTQLDYMTMEIQRLQDQASRSLQLSPGTPATFDPTLPLGFQARPLYLIGLNSTATGLFLYPQVTSGGGGGGGAGTILAQVPGGGFSPITAITAVAPLQITTSGATGIVAAISTTGNGNTVVLQNAASMTNLNSNNTTLTGNTNINGPLRITGNTNATGNWNVNGNSNLNGNTTIAGPLNVTTNATVTGNSNVSGNFSVTGSSNLNGNVAVVNLTASGNSNATNANFTNSTATNSNSTNAQATNSNVTGRFILPTSAGAPTGTASGETHYDSTRQATVSNEPMAAVFPFSGCLPVLTANSATSVLNAETNIGLAITVPANAFVVGKVLHITGTGSVVFGSPFGQSTAGLSYIPRLRASTSGILIAQSSNAAANSFLPALGTTPFWWDIWVTCRSVGTSGTLKADGRFLYGAVSLTEASPLTSDQATHAAVTYNTTIQQTLQMTVLHPSPSNNFTWTTTLEQEIPQVMN